MTFVSYAQNFEDVMLWRALRDIEAGNYLDVGAQDPVVDSVSRAFYDAGWRGIHVEPTPNYARALRENRPDELVIKAVISTDSGLRNFYEIPGTGLSTGVEEIAEQHRAAGWEVVHRTVPSVPLASLLDQFEGKDIHWLKIDVEGMELDVLRSWGDHPARPWILVIESTYPNTQKPTHHAWIDEVTRRGYSEVYFDGLSRFFLIETQSHRAAAFSAPPNVFDGFHVERHHFASGLVRQGEEAMEQRMAVTEQRATEQEAAQQLELARRDEDYGQREALHHEQVEHLQHALRELEQAQDHFPALIGEKEGEIALLRQQLDHLRASHDRALERLQSDITRGEEAHRAHVHGLETALAVAQAAMDRLGLELDRRASELAAARSQWEEAQQRNREQVAGLRATLSDRESGLQTALQTLKEAARTQADREQRLEHGLQSLGEHLDAARQALTEAEQSHRARQAELESALESRDGELESAHGMLEQAQASSAEREGRLHHQLGDQQEELSALQQVLEQTRVSAAEREQQVHQQLHETREGRSALQQVLEQRQVELAEQAARLNSASSLLLDLQSRRLWRKAWFGRTAIDEVEFAALSSRVSEFLSQPAQENIAAQQDPLDRGLKSVTASDMSMDISASNAPRAATLDELLSHHDLAFVRCAYRTVLGREPDPAGDAYYLARLRSGLAKMHILSQMRRCDEGRLHDPGIAGLDKAIRQYRLGRMPLWGRVIRQFTGSEGDSLTDRRHRAFVNDLRVLRAEQCAQSIQLSHLAQSIQSLRGMDATLTHIVHSIEWLRGTTLTSSLTSLEPIPPAVELPSTESVEQHPGMPQHEPIELRRLTARGRNLYLRLVAAH